MSYIGIMKEEYYHRRACDILLSVQADIESGIVRREDIVSYLHGSTIVPFCESLRTLSIEECNVRIGKLSLAEKDGLKVTFSRALLKRFERG